MVKVIFRWSNRGNICWCYNGCYHVSPYHWRTIRYTWVCKRTNNERHIHNFTFPGFCDMFERNYFPFNVTTCFSHCFLDSGSSLLQCTNLRLVFNSGLCTFLLNSSNHFCVPNNWQENWFQTRKSNGMVCTCVLNVYPHWCVLSSAYFQVSLQPL